MFKFFKGLFRIPKRDVETAKKEQPILSSIAWTFNRKAYDSQRDFDGEIRRYQKDVLRERANWDGQHMVIDAAEIEICYEAWIRGNDDLKSNEVLLDEEQIVFDEAYADDGFYQAEICARLQAANGVNFTALDLMYQMEHQVSNKDLGDHIFFEGFAPVQKQGKQFPVYYMYCGSCSAVERWFIMSF